MLDPTQTLLVAVITTLTVLLTIIGVQVVQILKEIKKTLEKANNLLDESGKIVTAISQPLEGASDFVRGLKKGANILNLLSRLFKDKEESEAEEDE